MTEEGKPRDWIKIVSVIVAILGLICTACFGFDKLLRDRQDRKTGLVGEYRFKDFALVPTINTEYESIRKLIDRELLQAIATKSIESKSEISADSKRAAEGAALAIYSALSEKFPYLPPKSFTDYTNLCSMTVTNRGNITLEEVVVATHKKGIVEIKSPGNAVELRDFNELITLPDLPAGYEVEIRFWYGGYSPDDLKLTHHDGKGILRPGFDGDPLWICGYVGIGLLGFVIGFFLGGVVTWMEFNLKTKNHDKAGSQ